MRENIADVLIYWRDYAANRGSSPGKASGLPDDGAGGNHGGGVLFWHSSAKCIAELQPGDRMWVVTSGKGLREEAEQAAFLVDVWAVREVIENPDDDPAYTSEDYRKRVVADPGHL